MAGEEGSCARCLLLPTASLLCACPLLWFLRAEQGHSLRPQHPHAHKWLLERDETQHLFPASVCSDTAVTFVRPWHRSDFSLLACRLSTLGHEHKTRGWLSLHSSPPDSWAPALLPGRIFWLTPPKNCTSTVSHPKPALWHFKEELRCKPSGATHSPLHDVSDLICSFPYLGVWLMLCGLVGMRWMSWGWVCSAGPVSSQVPGCPLPHPLWIGWGLVLCSGLHCTFSTFSRYRAEFWSSEWLSCGQMLPVCLLKPCWIKPSTLGGKPKTFGRTNGLGISLGQNQFYRALQKRSLSPSWARIFKMNWNASFKKVNFEMLLKVLRCQSVISLGERVQIRLIKVSLCFDFFCFLNFIA